MNAPTESTMMRMLARWWPSRRLGWDPLADLTVDGRYVPVSIANWKLTPWMRRTVLDRRHRVQLQFDASRRLTIVIPFRDREAHLLRLLPELISILQRQSVRARVLVVEQVPGGLFNRGKLLNAGMHASAADTDYYCLHDVDAVPVEANYECPSQPLRLVNTVLREGQAEQRTAHYFSGAVSVRKEQIFAANGYSNEYWGWGKEDDDLFFRLLLAGFVSYFDTRGVFRDLPNPKHQQVSRKPRGRPSFVAANRARRSSLLRGLSDPAADGLSNLRYEIVDRQQRESHELLRVRL